MTNGVKYKNSESNMKQEETAHSHEHHHHHANHAIAMARIALTVVLLIVAKVIEHYTALPMWKWLIVYLVPYLIVGWGTLKEAAEGMATFLMKTF